MLSETKLTFIYHSVEYWLASSDKLMTLLFTLIAYLLIGILVYSFISCQCISTSPQNKDINFLLL